MTEPAKRVCPQCNGVGFLYNEEGDVRSPCNCKIAEYMTKHLGTEIARAKTIYKSPLYVLPDKSGEPPKLDRTRENLHIKCAWTDLLPHLKLCLWTKGIGFEFRIVTDEKIKTVFVGAESYNARAKSKRDDMVTNNSLNDLLGKEFPFIILRLGHLGHKNQAAAGAVKEALMIRDVEQKPTWIIEEPNSPFGPGNFTWSEDLEDYMTRNYKTVEFARDGDSRVYEPRGFAGAEEVIGGVEDVSPSAPVVRPAKTRPKPPESTVEAEETFSFEMPGEGGGGGVGKYKPKSKRSWSKGGGGGGPV